ANPLGLHGENRLRLPFGQPEFGRQAFTGFRDRLCPSNQRDDRVQMVDCDLQPLEDVVASLRLAKLEFSTPANDLAPKVDEALDQLEQRQDLGAAADNGQHDDPEAELELRGFLQFVENN